MRNDEPLIKRLVEMDAASFERAMLHGYCTVNFSSNSQGPWMPVALTAKVKDDATRRRKSKAQQSTIDSVQERI